ncbi:hypothetical protein BaRGS_00000823 [Batillaria attramentaria]|uniref:Uncharacterized protein n=1 Tax=Batillaria attramentaria TaxID=370345 RepID=A0ABD0M9F5_9CAEN
MAKDKERQEGSEARARGDNRQAGRSSICPSPPTNRRRMSTPLSKIDALVGWRGPWKGREKVLEQEGKNERGWVQGWRVVMFWDQLKGWGAFLSMDGEWGWGVDGGILGRRKGKCSVLMVPLHNI